MHASPARSYEPCSFSGLGCLLSRHRVHGGSGVGAGGFLRRVGAALLGRPAGARARSRARGLSRHSDQRRRAAARRSLGRLDSDAARVAVPSALGRLHLARAVEPAHLEGGRSGLARDHRVSRRVAALGGPCDLSRRPSASAGRRAAHLGRLLDREVGRRHAHRHRHASEGRVSAPQRPAAQRQGDADRALDPQRRLPDGDDDRHRSGVPHRAVRPHDRLRARTATSRCRRIRAASCRKSIARRARCRTSCRAPTRT